MPVPVPVPVSAAAGAQSRAARAAAAFAHRRTERRRSLLAGSSSKSLTIGGGSSGSGIVFVSGGGGGTGLPVYPWLNLDAQTAPTTATGIGNIWPNSATAATAFNGITGAGANPPVGVAYTPIVPLLTAPTYVPSDSSLTGLSRFTSSWQLSPSSWNFWVPGEEKPGRRGRKGAAARFSGAAEVQKNERLADS